MSREPRPSARALVCNRSATVRATSRIAERGGFTDRQDITVIADQRETDHSASARSPWRIRQSNSQSFRARGHRKQNTVYQCTAAVTVLRYAYQYSLVPYICTALPVLALIYELLCRCSGSNFWREGGGAVDIRWCYYMNYYVDVHVQVVFLRPG